MDSSYKSVLSPLGLNRRTLNILGIYLPFIIFLSLILFVKAVIFDASYHCFYRFILLKVHFWEFVHNLICLSCFIILVKLVYYSSSYIYFFFLVCFLVHFIHLLNIWWFVVLNIINDTCYGILNSLFNFLKPFFLSLRPPLPLLYHRFHSLLVSLLEDRKADFPFQINESHHDNYGKIDEKDKAYGPNHAPSFIHFQVRCQGEREQCQVIRDKLQTNFIEKLLALACFGLIGPNLP